MQGGVDSGSHFAGFFAEAHVAAAECQSVIGTDDGAGDELYLRVHLAQQVAYDGYLLEVFLAEVAAIWLSELEEAAYHNGNAGEVAWTARSFHHLFYLAEVIDGGYGFGVHLLDRGGEGYVGAGFLEQGEVVLDGAGILLEVFLVVELYGVDEDADYDDVVLLAGTLDE